MENKETCFEYYNEILGVKTKYLTTDRNHPESLRLISYNALYKRCQSDTQPEKELRRGSLGFEALVEFDSLSREWRDALELAFGKPKEKIKQSFFAKHYASDRKAFDFFNAHRYNGDMKLSPEVIELYTYNASVLNTVIEVKNNRKVYHKALGVQGKFDIWESLSNDVNAFQDVRHDLPTTRDTLRRKVTRYIKEGYASIISGKYGSKNAAKVYTKEQEALIEELLSKHQNLNNEQIVNFYNKVALKAGWETIGAGVIANLRKKFDIYIYSGNRSIVEFKTKRYMQNKRYAPTSAMLYWCIDGNDIELLYQTTKVDSKGYNVTSYSNRLNTVMVFDPFNKYIIGYAIGTHESPDLIRQAMKNAVKHTEELFGYMYKPWQLQTDRYQIKNIRPVYEQLTKYFTPAEAHNAKAKSIENFFDKFNEKYFQEELAINYSGHNVTSRKENQPNSDYLNKVRHQFPNELECRQQIIEAIEKDRALKVEDYVKSYSAFDDKIEMSLNQYLRAFGKTTGFTNRFQGQGLTPTINGIQRTYDTFDINFRRHFHEDWIVYYDEDDLSKVLVSNAESINGRMTKEIGTLEYILEEKHVQAMALYDATEEDNQYRNRIKAHNKELLDSVIDRQIQRGDIIEELFLNNPQLDILQKLMITDSRGQHKDQKSQARLDNIQKVLEKQNKKKEKEFASNWKDIQDEYLNKTVDTDKYLNL